MYNMQRIPSPPPTLIRRYSSSSSSVISVSKPSAVIVPIESVTERRAHRRELRNLKNLTKTKPSSFIKGTSYGETLKNNYRAETRHAFQCSKLYALRQSPAIIEWPQKPIEPVPDEESDDEISGSVLEFDDTRSRKMTAARAMSVRRERKDSIASEDLDDKRKTKQGSRSTKDDSEEGFVSVVNSNSNTSFWDNAVGNIRIDSIFLGAPRRDPYHSKWTRDQRRCFFISNFVPHHQRMHVLPSLEKKDAQRQDATKMMGDDRRMEKSRDSGRDGGVFKMNDW